MRRQLVMVAALSAILAGFANAQTVSAISPEMHIFSSPMILEVAPLMFQGDVFQVDLKNYSCRGVTIENFFIFRNWGSSNRKTATTPENRALDLRAALFNSSAKDKQSVLRVDLIAGESVVSSGALAMNTSPDEKRVDHRPFPNPPNPEELAKAKIRITMTCPDR